MGTIRLVVQADDLGMCRAVNEGIALAVTDGIVTQTSVMAPAPWFAEGAAIVRRIGVASGLHATLTCEWRYLRWAPLSAGGTARRDDGTMHTTVEAAAAAISEADATAELRAQARRARDCGLDLAYVDCHMGISVVGAYAAVSNELGVRFMYPGVEPHHVFDSFRFVSVDSPDDLDARTGRFVDWLERLDAGVHLALTHPATSSPELRAVCDPDDDNAVWAETWRVADLAALTDPAVRSVIERRGIELIDVSAL